MSFSVREIRNRYSQILTRDRIKPSETGQKMGRELLEETLSDRARIIFSAPFRRLQQKAQVFSLEDNAAVRSRLTHSLEVANTGKWIAELITRELCERQHLEKCLRVPFINLVENACLMHDLGNPPFGHFGEAAIQKWFTENWSDLFGKLSNAEKTKKAKSTYLKDFENFDGNPQGVRIICHLQERFPNCEDKGLNLTLSQVLTYLKYPCVSYRREKAAHGKKAGYFITEAYVIKEAQSRFKVNSNARFPLTYIMEAADDISYCLSDFEDGIEKSIFTINEFFKKLDQEIAGLHCKDFKTQVWDQIMSIEEKERRFFEFKVKFAQHFIKKTKDLYLSQESEILAGQVTSIFERAPQEKAVLNALKNLARRIIYRTPDAENKEVAGYEIIYGILDSYKKLLELPRAKFNQLLRARDGDPSLAKGMDIELRLLNRLPLKYLATYQHFLLPEDRKKFTQTHSIDIDEKFLRCHLITDYISGMTDYFALETYQLLKGIKL